MNAAHQDLIRRNYTSLAKALSPRIKGITRLLYEKQIISSSMKKDIECERTNIDRSYVLLDHIPMRGAKAFDCLYVAALEEELFDVADILNPDAAPHDSVIPQVTVQPHLIYKPTEDKLPDKWPWEDMESYKNVKLVQSNHIQMIELFRQSLTPAGQEYIYQMSGKPRGRVLIINNDKFNHMSNRDGTFKDQEALEILFRSLSFDVHCEKDKTAQEMKDLLQAEAVNVDHSPYNCFILFILSHGHRGVVFGVDGHQKKKDYGSTYTYNYIEIGTIVDLFCKAKSLQGKPKLFFIQADQGFRQSRFHYHMAKDGGHQEGQSTEQQHSPMIVGNEPTPPASEAACSSTEATSHSAAPSGATPAASSTTHTIILYDTIGNVLGQMGPSGSDVFVANATIPGFVSYRSKTLGTWFIQAIVFVFANYAYKYDLGKLMTMVYKLVGRAETEQGYRQVGEKKDTFQKEFYFFPGLCEPQS